MAKPTLTKAQVEKFREAARELETDDSEESFDRALKQVAVKGKPQEPQYSLMRATSTT